MFFNLSLLLFILQFLQQCLNSIAKIHKRSLLPDCVFVWISAISLSWASNLFCWSCNLELISWIWCCIAVISEWIKSGSFKSIRFSSTAVATNAKQAKRNMFKEANVIVKTDFGTYNWSLFIRFTSQGYSFDHTGRPAIFLGRQGTIFCFRKISFDFFLKLIIYIYICKGYSNKRPSSSY